MFAETRGLKTKAYTGSATTNLGTDLGRKARIYGLLLNSHTSAAATSIQLVHGQVIAGIVAVNRIAAVVNLGVGERRFHNGQPLASTPMTDANMSVAGVYGSFPPGIPVRHRQDTEGAVGTDGDNDLQLVCVIPAGNVAIVFYTND